MGFVRRLLQEEAEAERRKRWWYGEGKGKENGNGIVTSSSCGLVQIVSDAFWPV